MKAFIAATALTFGLAASATAQDKVTFQLDWLPGGEKAPIFVCINRGFCADAGLEVSIESGRGSSEALTKLATGTSDIGIADIAALLAAKANENIAVTAVMSIFNNGPHAFFMLEGGSVTKVEDLAGKNVATSPFTSSNLYLPQILGAHGLAEADLTLTKSDPGALGPMLMTGQVDAIIAWVTDVSRYSAQADEAGKKLVVVPWSDSGIEMYGTSLVAADKFLSERPDVARRFVDAYRKSVEYCRENPDDAAQAVVDSVPELTVESARGSLGDALGLIFNARTEAEGLGTLSPERLRSTWERVAQAQGLEVNGFDPEKAVDRSFLSGQ